MSAAERPIRVMIVDDHPLVRDGLRTHISRQADLEVCGEAESEPAALQLLDSVQPDVVVVDISLKEGSGIDLIKQMAGHDQSPQMLVFSMYDEDIYAERALRAGARGFVNKQEDPQRLVEAIRRVRTGQFFLSDRMAGRLMGQAVACHGSETSAVQRLTDRELEVFRQLGRACGVHEIADNMDIRPKTVETYRDRIRRKLNIPNARLLARFAVKWVTENDAD